jgi:SNF2 family DNA or RNA helicase
MPDRLTIAVLKRDAKSRRDRLATALKHDDVVVIANWETVLMKIPKLFSINWGAFIGDEAHRLKSRKSRTVKMVRRIQAVHILLLSGTFVEKTPADWWTPLSIIQPRLFSSYWTWVSWYATTHNNGFGTSVVGAKNSKLMQEHLKPFVLRRRAQDVANMPEVVEEDVITELPDEHRTIYDEAVKAVILELRSGELDIPNQAARIVRLRQLTVHPALLDHDLWGNTPNGKLDVLKDLLTDVIPQDEQVLVYSTFVDGAILAAHISGGEVFAGERDDPQALVRFQRGNSRTLCATPAKGGVGLNLYNANYVVYLDKPWSSIQWRQSRDRAVAVGKTDPVMIYTLVAKDTIDEYVVKVLMRKIKTITESDVVMQVKMVLVEN